MSDETTYSEEEIFAAREILKKTGHNVLTQDQMRERLERAKRDIPTLKEQLDSATNELLETQKRLKAYEDRGKSAEEKIAAELEAKQRQIEAYEKKLLETKQEREREHTLRKTEAIERELLTLLPDSAVPRHVLIREARETLRGLDAEYIDGRFTLTYTGPDQLPGDAKEAIEGWYKEQTWAHKPTGERIPTNGHNRTSEPALKKLNEMTGEEAAFYVAEKGV